ncbi:MAG: hypothetical protein JXA93_08210 [Anaerolineae bacterium]|nr:hypothetical protein [Anaerolineae bacterium]
MEWVKHRRQSVRLAHVWLLAILFVGLVIRWAVTILGVEVLLTKTLPDDAFYYFKIARSITLGQGVTFDGLAPTNGFHPLWMVVLLPIFAIFQSDRAIILALAVASCFDAVSAAMVYRVVKRLTGRVEPGVLAALFYFLNPFVWMFSLNGLETALNVMLIAVVVERVVAFQDRPVLRTLDAAILGALLGLALLARTDNVFLLAACGLAILLWRHLAFAQRLGRLVTVGAVLAAVTAPWFLWNWFTFGSIMQVSGSILPYLEHQIFALAAAGQPLFLVTVRHTFLLLYEGAVSTLIYAGLGRLNHIEGSIVMVTLLLVGLCTLGRSVLDAQRELWQRVRRLGFLILFAALLFVFHQGVRWVYREWYTLPITWTVSILVGLGVAALGRAVGLDAQRERRWYQAIWTIMFVLLLVRNYDFWRPGLYHPQAALRGLVANIERLTPGSVVGVSDSGYVGYRSTQTIVNMDGVVNNEVARAIRAGDVMSYVLASGIDYIYSSPRYVNSTFYGPHFQQYLRLEGDGGYKVMLDRSEREAYFALPEDGTIDFGTAWAWKYMGEGWSRAEPLAEGIWADAQEAALYVAFPPHTSAGADYQVELDMIPFSHGAPEAQSVTMVVNGVAVEPILLEADRRDTYQAHIPYDLVVDGVNIIELRFAYALSPKSVGYNDDVRTLAVWVSSIRFVEKEGAGR